MKNIRSSKDQGGFIGIIILIAVAYFIVIPLFFSFGTNWAVKHDARVSAEERAQYSDTEWVVKKEYELAQSKYCTEDPYRKIASWCSNMTKEEWAKTPSAIKAITNRMGNRAEAAWAEENVTQYTIPGNPTTQKRYPSMSEVPCTYTYLNKTYKCQEWR